MPISHNLQKSIENASWIRKMFEQGRILIDKYGAENVFDFSIGNPVFEPPREVTEALIDLLQSDKKGIHRYMSNQGVPEARSFIAQQFTKETGLPFTDNDIIISAGAAGGLNVVIKTLFNPGDELIVFTPYFMEYRAYAMNHGAVLKEVPTTPEFQLDFEALESAITPKTRAVLINSPNNPSGVVYPEEDIRTLGSLLEKKSKEIGHTITLLSDEPYRKISYDDVKVPSIFDHYEESMIVASHSKDLALPGERIGYIAVSPKTEQKKLVIEGLVISQRTLGFVNAAALFQHILPQVGDALVDLEVYRTNRDLLYNHLTECGFSCVKPQGAFYLFPKCPVDDDMLFVSAAQEMNLLLVPGRGFGTPGYFRISYCFETDMIQRSLPLFTQLAEQFATSMRV